VATWNPASYLIEGLRSFVIAGWDGGALGMAFGVAGALTVVGLAGAATALGRRLAR
jgi:hypothetical protein